MRWLASNRQNAIGQTVRRQHLTSTISYHLHQPTHPEEPPRVTAVLQSPPGRAASYLAFASSASEGKLCRNSHIYYCDETPCLSGLCDTAGESTPTCKRLSSCRRAVEASTVSDKAVVLTAT
jgi:hypothetical protein